MSGAVASAGNATDVPQVNHRQCVRLAT